MTDDDIAAAVLSWTVILRELYELDKSSALADAPDSTAELQRVEHARTALIR